MVAACESRRFGCCFSLCRFETVRSTKWLGGRVNCLTVLIIVAIIVFVISRLGRDGDGGNPARARRAYRRLTERFGGQYRSRGLRRRPAVTFRYGATWVEVTTNWSRNRWIAEGDGCSARHRLDQPHPYSGRWSTEVSVHWPEHQFGMEIVTPGLAFSPMTHQVCREEWLLEGTDFDQRFRIRTNDKERATRILSAAVRCRMVQLAEMYVGAPLRILWWNGTLSVEVPHPIARSDELERFTQLSLDLYDQCMLTQVEGIEFLKEEEAQLIEESICQVCGEPINSDMVCCQRCQTPHHRECWEYIGFCSMFGCREKRFVVPDVGQRTDPGKAAEHGSRRSGDFPGERPLE
jgi:hypothetical protein